MARSSSRESAKNKKTKQVEGRVKKEPHQAPSPKKDISTLQDAAGNQAVSQLIASGQVIPPDHPLESEADQVADSSVSDGEQRQHPVKLSSSTEPRPHPDIADELTSGQLLSDELRTQFEGQLGQDLRGVQIHADPKAAQIADQLNAQAFTTGKHIVFGTGQFAPNEQQGQQLLAHEIAHVAQQQGGAVSGTPVMRKPRQPEMREATTADREEFIDMMVRFLNAGADSYRAGASMNEARLERQLQGWLQMATNGENIINNFLDGDTARLRALQDAYRNAVTALMTAAASQLNRDVNSLYNVYQDRIHPWVAITDPQANILSSALSERERRRIRVIKSAVRITNLPELFSTETATTTIPLPENVAVRYGGTIPDTLRHGLQNVAATLIPNPLELNSTVTLVLDLTPHGGEHSAYRFTFVEHRPQRGRRSREVLIEHLGRVGVERLSRQEAETTQTQFDQHGFRRGSGWDDEEFGALLQALTLFPAGMLTPINGIRFERDTAHPTDPDVGGQYDEESHTITIFDNSFEASLTRYGVPGQQFANTAVRNIAHEIGHALDLLAVRQAWQQSEQTFTQARADLQREFGQFESPPGSGRFSGFPANQQTRFNEIIRRQQEARQQRERARSASGYRWQRSQQTGEYELIEGGTAVGSNEFRRAARADGNVRITHYSDQEWQEYFAEAFSFYMTDPDGLQRLRPHIYEYFAQRYPR